MKFLKLETQCGAPLYVLPMSHLESVAVGVLVRVGSRDENWPKEAGLAHAFEHIVFQGNKKFRTGGEVTSFIEEIGGSINAGTDSEKTFYYAYLPSRYFERGVEILYWMLETSTFRRKHIKTEMQSVIQEIKRRNDDPEELVSDNLQELVYENHPLSKDILGTIESVKGFGRSDFRRFKEKFYHSANYAFLAVGKIDRRQALDAFDRYFNEKATKEMNSPTPSALRSTSRQIRVLEKDVDQVHVSLGAPIGPADQRETTALEFFSVMLDGNGSMSFPLFQELRDKRGLCYAINVDVVRYADQSLFRIYTGTEPQRLEEALRALFKVIEKCGRDEKLFLRAKRFIAGEAALYYGNPLRIIDEAAEDIFLLAKPLTQKEVLAEVESIAFDEVREAVRKYLNPENFFKAYIVPRNFKLK